MEQDKDNEIKTKDSIEDLKKELEECKKIRDEYLNGWKRERADFLNYKKEEKSRIEYFCDRMLEVVILKILHIIDNFEIALKSEYNEGFARIKKQLDDFLKSEGVEEIESLGKKFSPDIHEAVEEVKKENIEPGIIIEEVQKGYKLKGKLLRPAKVKVAK
jgi:molecular chaperone GrpE